MIKAQLQQGFYPDFIDTDIVTMNAYERPMFSLPYTMSVYLNLGFGLNDVIRMVTSNVAELMHMEGCIGTLRPGAKADIAIMKLSDEPRIFYDAHGGSIEGDKLLIPLITLVDGKVMYRNIEY
ncbi:MAG: amidohydrolase family protein [Erysipelotrichaceae bacterium]|nr:amidohydrolase family protein [Erysipelotrichaceae bacterium]